ncbi:MAG: glycosyltransferase, partial [Alphaproteobacteria bacterium]|nr:glycosyltransferase [Hyphomicrobiales bacterium]MBV8651147.1 glycosyltransferase [Alphaproteobacteria bacterium]
VLVEALACGTQVVSTDCPYGPSEILDGGRYGRLVTVGHPPALAQAMRDALDKPLPRALLRRRALDFSLSAVLPAYLAAFRKALPTPAETRESRLERPLHRVARARRRAGAWARSDASPERRSVAMFVYSLAGGGMERMKLAVAQELVRQGHEVTLVLTKFEGELRNMVPDGVGIVDLGASRTLSALLPLIRYLRRNEPDVLLSSLGHSNIIAILARGIARVRTAVIAMQHNAVEDEITTTRFWHRGLLPVLYRIFLSRADGIYAVSHGLAEDLARVARLPRERVGVLYNPAFRADFGDLASTPIDDPWASGEPPLFIAVGRLVEQKDFATLLRAFALARRQRACRLAVLGDGPLRGELAREAEDLGILADVRFLGFVPNPLPWIAAAACLVMSSRHEGFGNVLVEALGCGTQVVSTDCPFGPSEILEGGRYGRLVPVGDVPALAQAMLRALDDPMPEQALRERASAFSLATAGRAYLDAFSRATACAE